MADHVCVPTQDAYDRAVAALEKHRARADAAEADAATMRAALEQIARRDFTGANGAVIVARDVLADLDAVRAGRG